jgi:hypothetical protein
MLLREDCFSAGKPGPRFSAEKQSDRLSLSFCLISLFSTVFDGLLIFEERWDR